MDKIILLLFAFICFFPSCQSKTVKNMPENVENEVKNLSEINNGILYDENDIFHVFENKNSVVIKSEMLPNQKRYILVFCDQNSVEINRHEIYGEYKFSILDSIGKLIASQYAVLVRGNESYLFDFNGNIIFTFIHDYENKQVEITNDNNYVIFVSNKMRPLEEGETPLYPSFNYTAYNHLIIYNLNNGLLEKEIDFYETVNVEIEIEGKKYPMELIPADIPG